MKPPLNRDQLRIIQDRNLRYADAMTLLREIKRLRGIVNEASSLLHIWGERNEETLERVERLSNALETEPCVAEAQFDQFHASQDEIAKKRNAQPKYPSSGIR